MNKAGEAPQGPVRRRAGAMMALKLAAALLLTWLVLRKVDFAHALAVADSLSAITALGALVLLALQAVLSAWRWMLVSRRTAAALPYWPAYRLFMIGLFYTQALPSTFPGDAVRVWGGARFGSAGEAAIGVFLDRLLTLLALLLLAAMSLAVLAIRSHGDPVALVPAAILTAGFLVLALAVAFRAYLTSLVPGKAGRFAARLAQSVHCLFRSGDSFGLCLLSLVIQVFSIVTIVLLASGMGLALTMAAAFVSMPLVMLAALLPVSVNGWGVREGAMIALLAGFGIGHTEAATLSVIYGLFQLGLGLSGGLFVLFPAGSADAKATMPS